ncbi:hypothetical protein ASPACDRAFT_52063 [Aspergillus aculeatus ATCC 16872]|uniref:Uncharacterized protein n=1 Tax=Aspergillus aculeatus (strain ATCC 16872 / CBS 172.66 / WB 5094) TaxID=690307 RepID=A0A1L9WWM4_ASPA1|nr:uncharacterized protein ASPACDRAFT_52063 [Aspergillus aculeatus ATCC 16872]OJK00328.1 hypothetical protein ASPACDRAFT_52063 [Aspergillus aculeatus ATCC 16872]
MSSTIDLGDSFPSLTTHAVSMFLPTWTADTDYEEGAKTANIKAMLFPSREAAERCRDFIITIKAEAAKEVLVGNDLLPIAKQYWQHSGDGISVRQADRHHKAVPENRESTQSLEERFGRNLDLSFTKVDLSSTAAVKQSSSQANSQGVTGVSDDDVYLYPCGMSIIFNTQRMLFAVRGQRKSISFGFPYVDTLEIWHGSSDRLDGLDGLEARLQAGERYLAFLCEIPGNPMLKSPGLRRVSELTDMYDFAVVVDETNGNSVHVQLLPPADVVVNSLTKIFTGDCNVMGGSVILDPESRYYLPLKGPHPLVKDVGYPKYSPTKRFYDKCRTPTGGYGDLLSFTFHPKKHTVAFLDRIETAKGPSLGTKFTLTFGVEIVEDLKARFAVALEAAEAIVSGSV